MPGAPDTLLLKTHRDRQHWWQSVWIRRVLLLLPLAMMVAGLLNFFGQRPVTSAATVPAAKLTVYAPVHARSGIVYAARFRIDAVQAIKDATLILDPGWADGYTLNGAGPQPLTEGSSNGKLNFGFGHIPAGQHVTFWLSLQVNPTNVGRHRQNVWLYDGSRQLALVRRTVTVFP